MVVVKMSIAQKIEKYYKNQTEMIKNEKNHILKIKMIGSLVLDLGDRCINKLSKIINHSRKFIKKCYLIVKNSLSITSNKSNCGRRKTIEKYRNLIQDINDIMKDYSYTDPHFETEQLYTDLSLNGILNKLVEKGYEENFICITTLSTILNQLGYNLRKVNRTKPLKKIKETDVIFDNVKKKKEEALSNKNAALISIDTKEKVLIGPYSRKGKTRVTINACDHELTNKCLIPFGILDIKNNQTYFYNFKNKPTSLAIVDCIEDYIRQNRQYENIIILLDNGPDNSGVRTAFLKGLVDVSNKYKITIELVYYPPYHSKYNPIERIWARLEKMWNGYLLTSENLCNKIMEQLTWKDIKAKVKFITKEYEKGVTYSKNEMKKYEGINIIRNEILKKWSIIITPHTF